MASRSRCFLKCTPDYGFVGEPTFLSLKIYYNGTMKGTSTSKQYVGGNIEYFDWVDSSKLCMRYLRGFADDLGLEEIDRLRFWHKVRSNSSKGKYLENDSDVLTITNNIPANHELEIYIACECDDESDNNCETCSDVNIEAEDDEEGEDEEGGVDEEGGEDEDGAEDEEGNDYEYEDEFYDSGYEFEEDDRLFNRYVDNDVECNDRVIADHGGIPNQVLTRMQNEEGDDNCVDSDDLDSNLDSDSDDRQSKRFPLFDPVKDAKNPELMVGMISSSRDEAKFPIESHCIRRGNSVRFVKVDKKRLRGRCRNKDCNWAIHVSPMGHDSCWQIKTFESGHNGCFWDHANKTAKSSWLGKTFVKKFKTNSKLGVVEFRDEIFSSLKLNISRKKAYLAKRKAIELVQGTIAQQFSKIRNYCLELKRVDPSATVVLKLIEDDDGSRFQHMYVCFSACKEGFKKACRPLIGVDGCFVKTKNGGQLLAAVGLDPNNNIFPICYALVERETKDTWMWFLQLLDSDIGFGDGYAWTFMSDKQKGLIPAFESLFPAAENRFCVRHLHSNMKRDGFKGTSVKNALWAAARATTVADFRHRMEELKQIDEKAYDWLAKKPEEQWSKSYFNTAPKCDVLLNNMCECFNSFILDAREKPIIPMFETIRNLLMVRFQLNREKAEKWDKKLCPKIINVLANIYMDAAQHSPLQADHTHFQNNGPSGQHTVDFGTNSCSCRKWDLTGIPCPHAVCAIWCKHQDPVDYVNPYYGVEAYKRCYEHAILPITGPELWPECELPPPLPPVYTEKVGRPAKLRRRERDEVPSGSHQHRAKRNTKCTKCGGYGHNKRTCKEIMESVHEHPTQQSQSRPAVNSKPVQSKKLEVRRPASQVGVQMEVGGSSNIVMQNPVFVRGGKNFVTVSKLRACVANQRKQSHSVPVQAEASVIPEQVDARAKSATGTCTRSTTEASIKNRLRF